MSKRFKKRYVLGEGRIDSSRNFRWWSTGVEKLESIAYQVYTVRAVPIGKYRLILERIERVTNGGNGK